VSPRAPACQDRTAEGCAGLSLPPQTAPATERWPPSHEVLLLLRSRVRHHDLQAHLPVAGLTRPVVPELGRAEARPSRPGCRRATCRAEPVSGTIIRPGAGQEPPLLAGLDTVGLAVRGGPDGPERGSAAPGPSPESASGCGPLPARAAALACTVVHSALSVAPTWRPPGVLGAAPAARAGRTGRAHPGRCRPARPPWWLSMPWAHVG